MELREVAVKQEHDRDPDVSWLEADSGRYDDVVPASKREACRREDAERLEAFRRDEWHMIGVYAAAELEVAGTIQHVRTPGLWNIESDSGAEHLETVGREQLEELAGIVRELRGQPDYITVRIVEEIRNAAPAPAVYV